MRFDSSFWRRCRITFRWCRIAVWLAVLALLCALVWLNRVGVPDFLKTRLVAAAHDRGIELQFSRLRLRFVRGLVADNVRIGGTNALGNPSLTLAEVQLKLDHTALLHRRLQLDALILRDGKLTLPVAPVGEPPPPLVLDGINARLQFQTNDTWTLDHFTADFAGAKISISGEIAHGSELHDLEIFRGRKSGGGTLPAQLKKISETVEKIHFNGAPEIELSVNGDARDLKTFVLRLGGRAPAAETPWGGADDIALAAEAKPLRDGELPQLILNLSAQNVRTPWGSLHRSSFVMHTEAAPAGKIPPAILHLETAAASSRWGDAQEISFDAQLAANKNAPTNLDAANGWWSNAQPYKLAWSAKLAQLKSEKLAADSVTLGGFWNSPELAITNFSAELGGGQLDALATLEVTTRELNFAARSDFDAHAIAALLTPKTRERLAEFVWPQPPVLSVSGALVLPAWTDQNPNWRAEVQPTIHLNGELAFTNAMVLGANIDSAHTHFTYEKLFWNLPDLKIAQGKTKLNLAGGEDDGTKDYHWHINGFFDPAAVRPFLTARNAVRGFSRVAFTQPVALDVNVRGRLYDFASLRANGQLAATNFSVRGQSVDSVTAKLSYANRVLEFLHPVLLRAGGSQTLTGDAVALDFNRKLILFTNGFSTVEPQVVGNAIGPKTAKIFSPYHFQTPPTALVRGQIPLRDMNGGRDLADADMTFNIIKGAPFRWSKLLATDITGTIHWTGQTLVLTDVVAELYGGTGSGSAYFDFRPVQHDCDYDFNFAVKDLNLRLLAADVELRTNRLEGQLSTQVTVTNASSADWHSWNGGGRARLRDGLLWDIPMFGIFSPALNAVSPGLGSSRATDAAGKFIITNGVVYTDDLEIRLAMSRLQYVGSFDLKQNVNARITAQLLRNTPGVGLLVTAVLWPVSKLFEYQVTGTLKDPKTTPLHDVPKVLMMPLHPIRSLEEMFPAGEDNYFTNAPTQK